MYPDISPPPPLPVICRTIILTNQQYCTLLTNFWLSSDAGILLIITDWAYKSTPNVQKRVCIVYIPGTYSDILHTTVGGCMGTSTTILGALETVQLHKRIWMTIRFGQHLRMRSTWSQKTRDQKGQGSDSETSVITGWGGGEAGVRSGVNRSSSSLIISAFGKQKKRSFLLRFF